MLRIPLMFENQLVSVTFLTAIWLSMQLESLAIVQNKVKACFSTQVLTGSIPTRVRKAVSDTLVHVGRHCSCLRHLFWKISSRSMSFFLRLWTSRPYILLAFCILVGRFCLYKQTSYNEVKVSSLSFYLRNHSLIKHKMSIKASHTVYFDHG